MKKKNRERKLPKEEQEAQEERKGEMIVVVVMATIDLIIWMAYGYMCCSNNLAYAIAFGVIAGLWTALCIWAIKEMTDEEENG